MVNSTKEKPLNGGTAWDFGEAPGGVVVKHPEFWLAIVGLIFILLSIVWAPLFGR